MKHLRNRYLWGGVLTFFLGGCLFAGPGTSSASFLRIGCGARPAAMGEAFTGLADDIDALYWNPAGLTRVARLEETFAHNAWIEGINGEYAAFAARLTPHSVAGAGLAYVSMGDIERLTKTGRDAGSYTAYDIAGMFSYAHSFGGSLSAGVTLKIVQEKIENESARAFALDAGGRYALRRWAFGFAARNIGSAMTFRSASSPLPFGLRGGAAYRLSEAWTLASDINLPADGSASLHLGGEYRYPGLKKLQLALRGGFKTSPLGYLDTLSALSFGLGLSGGEWGVDYALAPYGDFGMSHRVSVKLRFAAAAPAADAEARPAVRKVEIVIDKNGARVTRDPQAMYTEAMRWFNEKAANEKLGAAEQRQLLQRIQEKFEPLGVDVTQVKERLNALPNEEK